MADYYNTAPARKHVQMVPHDTNLSPHCRSIFVGGQGDVVIVDSQGVQLTYVGVIGTLNIIPTRIMSTGTTATNIIGFQ